MRRLENEDAVLCWGVHPERRDVCKWSCPEQQKTRVCRAADTGRAGQRRPAFFCNAFCIPAFICGTTFGKQWNELRVSGRVWFGAFGRHIAPASFHVSSHQPPFPAFVLGVKHCGHCCGTLGEWGGRLIGKRRWETGPPRLEGRAPQVAKGPCCKRTSGVVEWGGPLTLRGSCHARRAQARQKRDLDVLKAEHAALLQV